MTARIATGAVALLVAAGLMTNPVAADDFGIRFSYSGGGCSDAPVYYDHDYYNGRRGRSTQYYSETYSRGGHYRRYSSHNYRRSYRSRHAYSGGRHLKYAPRYSYRGHYRGGHDRYRGRRGVGIRFSYRR